MKKETPKQKFYLGDTIKINEHTYTVTTAEYTERSGEIVIWYRLMGPISTYKYETELLGILESKRI